MANLKRMLPENCPAWFNEKAINEAIFCQEFLANRRLIYTENAFFTVNGRMVDETPLKSAIYHDIALYATTNVTNQYHQLNWWYDTNPKRV